MKIKIKPYKAINWCKNQHLGEICPSQNKRKLQMTGNTMIILSYNFERKHTLMWLYYYSLFDYILSTLIIYNLTFDDHWKSWSHGPVRRASELILANLEIGRPDVKAETLILWPPDAKSWFIGKDLDAGKDWGQEEKGITEDEMVGWHHRLNGHGFGWTLGVGDGQGGLACCGSWGRKESNMTEQLNWTEPGNHKNIFLFL